ncbi:DnaJ subfamily C member 21 [Madurella mycetomatis]|uniref:DnaJ subfamily C member 21 n=1 Tax=Madurella mycetomatis TaxID=100816 RepID=A0A175VTG6_9PEZI|nr:DnaJ subfamily C member 21 [Madurella mycetomatis]KXX74726.1 DnaJ subfamily C member 21 [Madurella mycetomatis]
MGAEQSAPRGSGNQGTAATNRKACYYELLGVDRQVPDEEIRRAYRKKALELHPDRNLNDIENATRKFAEVQTAYEILSDPQERAWYDTHRDAILSGEDDAAGAEPAEQSRSGHTSANAIFALMSRFNSSVAMDDSPRGFFGILNGFFDQLAAEETAACEWAGIAPTEYPAFGRAEDDYNTVAKPFYSVWASFSTKKTFSWRDKYRLQEAPDRRIRRLMEKENKKFRDEGIREFNDAVLSLVAFVKKRDPRYVPNKQSEAERQQVLRDSAAAQAARSRAAYQEKLAEYVVPEWAQARDDEEQNDEFSLSEEESEVEQIECVVCNKTFKSEKQFEAHEKSKKHVKAVQQLRRQMKKENANLDLEDIETASSPAVTAGKGSEAEEDGRPTDPDATSGRKGMEKEESQSPIGEDNIDSSALSPSDTNDDEYAPRSAVEERIMSGGGKHTKAALSERDTEAGTVDSAAASISDLTLGEGKGEGKKAGKAKLKREKKAARQAAEAEAPDSHKCAVCKETFTSRTKLFSHIKEFDHATPVPSSKAGKKKRR